MKTILTLLVAMMASVALAGVDTNIPPENQVILRGPWTPTPDDTSKALKAVQKFLKNPKDVNEWQKSEIKHILANSSKYRVQFTGAYNVVYRKIIRCNFFPASRGRDEFPYWKKQRVNVYNGGFWFWQIEYDVERDDCLNFISNGYA